ncbi:hypothetical protein ABT369_30170 [Dactylosporangium sp. NPDC000244]|uniref:hypothetical protein n=1 Tax=Dactylosporangium sp. NPDC000244 TaxID=3154365 RepID=UPI0033262606
MAAIAWWPEHRSGPPPVGGSPSPSAAGAKVAWAGVADPAARLRRRRRHALRDRRRRPDLDRARRQRTAGPGGVGAVGTARSADGSTLYAAVDDAVSHRVYVYQRPAGKSWTRAGDPITSTGGGRALYQSADGRHWTGFPLVSG